MKLGEKDKEQEVRLDKEQEKGGKTANRRELERKRRRNEELNKGGSSERG